MTAVHAGIAYNAGHFPGNMCHSSMLISNATTTEKYVTDETGVEDSINVVEYFRFYVVEYFSFDLFRAA